MSDVEKTIAERERQSIRYEIRLQTAARYMFGAHTSRLSREQLEYLTSRIEGIAKE